MGIETTAEALKAADAVRALVKRPTAFVIIFACALCMTAGFTNAAASCNWGVYVSHLSGTTTEIGIHITGYEETTIHRFESLGHALAVGFCFVVGASACGCFLDKPHQKWGGRPLFGLALVTSALLLVCATLLTAKINWFRLGACCASCACGLMNAMSSLQFGPMYRVTHFTGTLTDLGAALGRLVNAAAQKTLLCRPLDVVEAAEVEVDLLRVMVFAPCWSCFFVGAIAGAYMEDVLGIYEFYVAAGANLLLGLTYAVAQRTPSAAAPPPAPAKSSQESLPLIAETSRLPGA